MSRFCVPENQGIIPTVHFLIASLTLFLVLPYFQLCLSLPLLLIISSQELHLELAEGAAGLLMKKNINQRLGLLWQLN